VPLGGTVPSTVVLYRRTLWNDFPKKLTRLSRTPGSIRSPDGPRQHIGRTEFQFETLNWVSGPSETATSDNGSSVNKPSSRPIRFVMERDCLLRALLCKNCVVLSKTNVL
jgi:hypothetical protein